VTKYEIPAKNTKKKDALKGDFRLLIVSSIRVPNSA
jgi:hypothetical protein